MALTSSKRTSGALFVACAAVCASLRSVDALPTFIPLIPNSLAIPWTIALGHINVEGGGPNNQFGIDFANSGYAWGLTLGCLDSDGDGLNNAFELGDPCIVWTEGGTPAYTSDISHPGNATSKPVSRTTGCATNPCSSLSSAVLADMQRVINLRNATIAHLRGASKRA